jgi:lysophospholipase L1-like esterase
VSAVVGTVRGKSLALKICLVVGSVALSLALGEGLLRLFANRLPVEIQQIVTASPDNLGVYHPYIGYLQRPNASLVYWGRDYSAVHHTDQYGFRNTEPWPQHASVVALGDSLTFGYGVGDDEAWPAVINRAWSDLRVMNLGVIGAGPQQYLRVYETFGQKLQPRLLVVGFFARNDFWDAALFDGWLTSDGGCNFLVWRAYGQPEDCGNSWWWKTVLLANRSYLQNLLQLARSSMRNWFESESKSFQFGDGSRVELDVRDFESKTTGAVPGRKEFRIVVEALQDLHFIGERDGTKMLVVLQPSKEEVYLPRLGETVADPSFHLREEFRQAGIDYLDLTAVFREHAAGGEKLFFEVDGHPNAAGYALIADAVLAHIKDNATEYGLNHPAIKSQQELLSTK